VLKATTRLVLVDVVATDKKGAVADLERSDFTVLEDGTEQQIRVFSFQHPTLGDHRPEAPRADLPDNVFTNIPSYPPTNALNVLLLDSINTTFQNQAYVRGQMLKYLEKMPEDQPIAVYLLSSNGRLTLLQDFTTDPAILRSVVKNFKSKASPLLDSSAGPELDIVPPGLNDPGTIGGQALQSMVAAMASLEQQHASFQADLRIKYTMAALTAISGGHIGRAS
jgi:VWFA-related protein